MELRVFDWDKLQSSLMEIWNHLSKLEPLSLSTLPAGKTALIIVDMVNGFVKEGPMSSKRVESINHRVANLLNHCQRYGILCLAFADCHTSDSPEFLSYPPHCLAGTTESEVTMEISQSGRFQTICKNSTNGFLEPTFSLWRNQHPQIDHYLVVGDCTDICISQFSIALKADFNRENRIGKVIVPIDLVETYDLGMHNGDLMNLTALYEMELNGVELVSTMIE
ncbi:MAG: cysteine hydrolase [Clostridiales bacterium]|jgi:nicotinamidase-related amidase|nr:cysteine hydrolase [Clostridiales bacterium]